MDLGTTNGAEERGDKQFGAMQDANGSSISPRRPLRLHLATTAQIERITRQIDSISHALSISI